VAAIEDAQQVVLLVRELELSTQQPAESSRVFGEVSTRAHMQNAESLLNLLQGSFREASDEPSSDIERNSLDPTNNDASTLENSVLVGSIDDAFAQWWPGVVVGVQLGPKHAR
jgi:hypothetical protein